MYETIKFINNTTEEVDFMGDVDPAGFLNCTSLDYDLDGRNVDRPKLEALGSWPTFAYYERLHINLEGDILAGADPHDFAVFKHNINQILMPLPETIQTDRTLGEFHIKMEGFSETYSVPVVVETPLKVIQDKNTGPSAGTFRIVFKAFRPYFVGLVSDAYFWVS